MDAKALALAGTPILLIDTCSILDIMRDPTRDGLNINQLQAALDLVRIAEQGGLWCGMAEQVAIEFAQLDQSVQDDAKKKLAKLRKRIERVDKLSGILGAPGTSKLSHLDDLVTRARGLVERWLNRLDKIEPGPHVLAKAMTRLNAAIAPAKRGASQMKDCVVYETCLEATTILRQVSAVQPIVFLSSNTNDYQESGSLKAEIEREFAPLNLQFAENMLAAKRQLGFQL